MPAGPRRDNGQVMTSLTPTDAAQALACAQCGSPLPTDPAAAARWRFGHLAARGELDETSAGVLLCPDCVADDASGDWDAGDAD